MREEYRSNNIMNKLNFALSGCLFSGKKGKFKVVRNIFLSGKIRKFS